MAPTTRVSAVAHRLAALVMLLAVLALGLHEAASPWAVVSQVGASPPASAVLQPGAALDHDEADRGPAKYTRGAQETCPVCAAAMPLPNEVGVVFRAAAAFGAHVGTAAPSGLDPRGPRRPPRSPAIA